MVTIYALSFNLYKYIGCTRGKLSKRLREHRCLLRGGKHKCSGLQTDWIAFGDATLTIETLEELAESCSLQERRDAELKWMNCYQMLGCLYNEHLISWQPPIGAPAKAAGARVANGYRQSAESNEKRRLAQLGKPKGHGAKISATKRARAMR